MSMMDSQLIKKYKTNSKRKNEKEGGAAYFGKGYHHFLDHSSELCDCSKTFQ